MTVMTPRRIKDFKVEILKVTRAHHHRREGILARRGEVED